MKVEIMATRPVSGRGNLRAFVDAQVMFDAGETVLIRSCRIIQQGQQRAYASLPQVQTTDGHFFPVLGSSDLRLAIERAVLAGWEGRSTP